MYSYEELLENNKRQRRQVSPEERRRRCGVGLLVFVLLAALGLAIGALVVALRPLSDPLTINTLNVTDRLTLPNCPTSVTVGSTAEYPTIQSVLDKYVGRLACPVKIIVSPGVYNENVALESTSSSLKSAPIAQGVSIEGDTRFLAGLAFMDGGLHNRPAFSPTSSTGSSNQAVSVALSSGNEFTITVSGLDLANHGYGAGDKIFIRDNGNTAYTRNITSISSNTVSFDGPALSDWAEGSYLVFQPNVEIRPVDKNATLTVNGGNLAVKGLMISSPLSNTLNQVFVSDGTLAMAQCFVEDFARASMTSVRASYNGHVIITDGEGARSVLTTVGAFESIYEDYNGAITNGNLNQFDAQASAVTCFTGHLSFETVQMSHDTVDFKFAVFQKCSVKIRNVKSFSSASGFAYMYLAGAAASLDMRSLPRRAIFNGNDNFLGIYAGSGAQVNADFGPIEMTGAAYPVLVVSDAAVSLDASSDFSASPTDLHFMADYSSRFQLLNDFSSEGGNNMVYRHSASGDMFKANVFRQQDIVANSLIDLTLDLDTSGGFGYTHHDAKTYTVTDTTGYNHTITLQNGAVFQGCNVPAGTNQIVFNGTPQAYVSMYVRSVDAVRIVAKECVTFNTVATKRTVRSAKRPYYTGPMGARYQNMTRSEMQEMINRLRL